MLHFFEAEFFGIWLHSVAHAKGGVADMLLSFWLQDFQNGPTFYLAP